MATPTNILLLGCSEREKEGERERERGKWRREYLWLFFSLSGLSIHEVRWYGQIYFNLFIYLFIYLFLAEVVSCTTNLPAFQVQGLSTSSVLPMRKQIFFPKQRFTCSGSIKMWGVAINGHGNIHLQVWRPVMTSSDMTRSFKLVGSNIFTIQPSQVRLLYLMPDKKRTLAVENGDVLGIYVQNTTEGLHVNYKNNMLESTIHAYDADTPMDTIQHDSPLSRVWLSAAPVMTVLLGMLS